MFEVIIRERALVMLDEAYNWYEEQLHGLGERLIAEVELSLDKLRTTPYYYSQLNNTYRRLILRRFPYKIIFEIQGTRVIVYAIFHAKQKPGKISGD